MWKRENESNAPAPQPAPTPAVRKDPEPAPAPVRHVESGGRAVIGPSIVVRGEVSGEEDLLVEGRVEGRIHLPQNAVTVGAKGQLSAEVQARIVMIDGEVEGNLVAEEQIVLRKSGRVRGDLAAPRVTIEDGARFKGSIDMEPKSSRPANAASASSQPARPTAVARSNEALAASLAAVASSNG